MNQLLEQPTLADFPPATADLDEEAILRRLELGDRNLEYDDGIFLEKNVSERSVYVGGWIYFLLMREAIKTGTARVYGSELIYRCWPEEPRRFRKPDASVIRAERVAALGPDPRTIRIAPDLAVEVISPTNTVDDLSEKLALYRAADFGPVWVAHLPTKIVDVHNRDGSVTRLRAGDEITAGDILPGFRHKIADLFGPPATA